MLSLALTIIIIVILAGITLSVTIGENGLITQAKLIASNTEIAEQEAQDKINILKAESGQFSEDGVMSIADTNSPTINSFSASANYIIATVNVTEVESGIDRIEYSKDNGSTWVTNKADKTAKQYIFTNVQPGTYIVKVRVYDKSGNLVEEASDTITIGDSSSDATATASDILSGKTAYVNGEKITGTIPDRNGIQHSKNQYLYAHTDGITYLVSWIPWGYYRGWQNASDGTSCAEVWIPQADLANALGITANKIAEGQTIAGVTGTAQVASSITPTVVLDKLDMTDNTTFTYTITPTSGKIYEIITFVNGSSGYTPSSTINTNGHTVLYSVNKTVTRSTEYQDRRIQIVWIKATSSNVITVTNKTGNEWAASYCECFLIN